MIIIMLNRINSCQSCSAIVDIVRFDPQNVRLINLWSLVSLTNKPKSVQPNECGWSHKLNEDMQSIHIAWLLLPIHMSSFDNNPHRFDAVEQLPFTEYYLTNSRHRFYTILRLHCRNSAIIFNGSSVLQELQTEHLTFGKLAQQTN